MVVFGFSDRVRLLEYLRRPSNLKRTAASPTSESLLLPDPRWHPSERDANTPETPESHQRTCCAGENMAGKEMRLRDAPD